MDIIRDDIFLTYVTSSNPLSKSTLSLFVWITFVGFIYSDVLSTTGRIEFDVNSDQSSEMILNSVGLGVGVTPQANLHILGNAMIQTTLSIGAVGASNLNISGSIAHSIESVSSSTILDENSFVLADSTAGNLSLVLPPANLYPGRTYTIKNIGSSNDIHLSSNSLIDMSSSYTLTSSGNIKPSLMVISNGIKWYVLEQSDGVQTTSIGNLVAYWSFDESSGNTINDLGSNSYEGTLFGGITMSSNSTNGAINGAISLDGIDDYVSISGTPLPYGTPAFSVSMWVKPSAANIAMPIIHFSENAVNEPFSIYYNGAFTQIIFDTLYPNDNTRYRKTSYTLSTTNYTHLVMSFDSTTVKFYENGSEIALTSLTGSALSAQTSRIGSNSSSSAVGGFSGSIDDVRLYNKVLSQSEIDTLFAVGTP